MYSPHPYVYQNYKEYDLDSLVPLSLVSKEANEELYLRLSPIIDSIFSIYKKNNKYLTDENLYDKIIYVFEYCKKNYDKSNGTFLNYFRKTLTVSLKNFLKDELKKLSRYSKKYVDIDEKSFENKLSTHQEHDNYLIDEISKIIVKCADKDTQKIYFNLLSGFSVKQICAKEKISKYILSKRLNSLKQIILNNNFV